MKVIFVGSLDINEKDFEIVKGNLKALVKTLVNKDIEFVLRAVVREGENRIPIDFLVHEALEECSNERRLSKNSLVVFKEPGVSSGKKISLPHITHSATTSYRNDFYKELLGLVDIVICLGGEHGLLRLTMVGEWIGKPILLLPGAGGAADFLWQEFFRKSAQIILFDDVQKIQLKQTPMINELNSDYSNIIYGLLQMTKETVEKGFKKKNGFITGDNISVPEVFSSFKRFSIGLWSIIIPIIVSLVSIGYYIGSIGSKNDLKKNTDTEIHQRDAYDKKSYRKEP